MPDRQIDVYVRLEGPDDRVLSFNPPPEISQKEALDKGFAIDGNSYVLGITADSIGAGNEVIPGSPLKQGSLLSVPDAPRPLAAVLADVQCEIVEWLGSFGYEVIFK